MEQDLQTKERRKSIFDDWNAFTDELKVQLHLGKMEAREEFEEQKKHLQKWISNTEKDLTHLQQKGVGDVAQLKSKLKDLEKQASEGKAEAESALKRQEELISQQVEEFRSELSSVKDKADEDLKSMVDYMQEDIRKIQTRFDLFRLQLHLAKQETSETWENKRSEIEESLERFKSEVGKNKENLSAEWNLFSDEMKESWKHLKNALKL